MIVRVSVRGPEYRIVVDSDWRFRVKVYQLMNDER